MKIWFILWRKKGRLKDFNSWGKQFSPYLLFHSPFCILCMDFHKSNIKHFQLKKITVIIFFTHKILSTSNQTKLLFLIEFTSTDYYFWLTNPINQTINNWLAARVLEMQVGFLCTGIYYKLTNTTRLGYFSYIYYVNLRLHRTTLIHQFQWQ